MLKFISASLIALLCVSCSPEGRSKSQKLGDAQHLIEAIAQGQMNRGQWCSRTNCSIAEDSFIKAVEFAARGRFESSYAAAKKCAVIAIKEGNSGLASLCATRMRAASMSSRGVQGASPRDMDLWASAVDVAFKSGGIHQDEARYEKWLAREVYALNLPERSVGHNLHSNVREFSLYGDLNGGHLQYPVIDVEVNGRLLKMGVDTGSPISLIYGQPAKKANADIFENISVEAGDNIGSGVSLHAALARSVKLAGLDIKNNVFLVPGPAPANIEIDGIIGLDIIRLLGSVTFQHDKIVVGGFMPKCRVPIVYSFRVFGWDPKLIIQGAKFNNHTVLAVIDTGSAFGITMSSALVRRFQLPVTSVETVVMRTFSTNKAVNIGRAHGVIDLGGASYSGNYDVRGMDGDIYLGMNLFYRDGLHLDFDDMTTCSPPTV